MTRIQKTDIMQTERISLDVNDGCDRNRRKSGGFSCWRNKFTRRVSDLWSTVETTRETGTGSGVIYKKQATKRISSQIITLWKVHKNLKLLSMMARRQTGKSLVAICGQT